MFFKILKTFIVLRKKAQMNKTKQKTFYVSFHNIKTRNKRLKRWLSLSKTSKEKTYGLKKVFFVYFLKSLQITSSKLPFFLSFNIIKNKELNNIRLNRLFSFPRPSEEIKFGLQNPDTTQG